MCVVCGCNVCVCVLVCSPRRARYVESVLERLLWPVCKVRSARRSLPHGFLRRKHSLNGYFSPNSLMAVAVRLVFKIIRINLTMLHRSRVTANFFSKIFGGTTATASASSNAMSASLEDKAVHLHHEHTIARWHQDLQPHNTIIFLHDVLHTCGTWNQVSRAVSRLPADAIRPLAPVRPLHIFFPDMRHHGRSATLSRSVSTLEDLVADVISFSHRVPLPPTPIHLVGIGLGGRVALAAALSEPSLFASVSVLNVDLRAGPTEARRLAAKGAVDALRAAGFRNGDDGPSSFAAIVEGLTKAFPNATERQNVALAIEEGRPAAPSQSEVPARLSINVDAIDASLNSWYGPITLSSSGAVQRGLKRFDGPVHILTPTPSPSPATPSGGDCATGFNEHFGNVTVTGCDLAGSSPVVTALAAEDVARKLLLPIGLIGDLSPELSQAAEASQ